jgi:hypothetical protein
MKYYRNPWRANNIYSALLLMLEIPRETLPLTNMGNKVSVCLDDLNNTVGDPKSQHQKTQNHLKNRPFQFRDIEWSAAIFYRPFDYRTGNIKQTTKTVAYVGYLILLVIKWSGN